MASPKTLAVIGASDETTAHIRLLMKLGARQLHHDWRWGELEVADFVAVEVHDLGCQGVLARCQAAGVPCALMAEANEVVVHGLVLRRPFKMDQIVAVLNAAGAASADAGPVESFSDDFYTRDLDDPEGAAAGARTGAGLGEGSQAPLRANREAAAADLDFLIHGDPLAEPEPPRRLITPDTVVEPTATYRTQRSEGRADQARHRMPAGVTGVETVDVAPIVLPPRNDGSIPNASDAPRDSGDGGGHRLADYLDGELLGSPSQLQLPDAPILTLDPKTRTYHADADLAALEPYARQPLPRNLVKLAGSNELARVRETQPARTYDELRWLLALLRGNGRLASRLDPGGSFQVEHPVHIDAGFHQHGAIAAALARPVRLHEIAAASGASMEQVFDLVSAYDAIGRLRSTPRQRLAAEPAPTEPKPGSGALSRFKWPFGKR